MYSIYTTPGFIIRSRANGEAGKLLSIFTRELGLVLASAQGIRLEQSKLRAFTQDYSFGLFSFVRGKEMWRLTSAQNLAANVSEPIKKGETSVPMVRIASLLERLLHGEEPHPELFDRIQSAVVFLSGNHDLSLEQTEAWESLIVLRILHSLGYIGNDADLKEYVVSDAVTVELVGNAALARKTINQHINKALRESHL